MEGIKYFPDEDKDNVLYLPNSYFEKGMKEGIQESKIEMALKLLTKGLSLEDIADVTGLSQEEIKKLKD